MIEENVNLVMSKQSTTIETKIKEAWYIETSVFIVKKYRTWCELFEGKVLALVGR